MTNSIVSKDAIVGTWKLVKVESVDKEQKISYPYGKNPVGYIIYTQDGHVSSSMVSNNRLNLGLPMAEVQKMAYGGKPNLIANIFKYITATVRYVQAGNKYAAFIGKYELRGDNKIIHHVEVHIIPDWMGVDMERTIEISEDILALTTSYAGAENSICTTWQRVS